MIGDLERTINDHTPKSAFRQWVQLLSKSGCNIEFIAKQPYQLVHSQWRHLDFGNLCINYFYTTTPFTAVHEPDLTEIRQQRNFRLTYTDTDAWLTHYNRLTRIPANSFVLLENAHFYKFEMEETISVGISINLDGDWLKKYIPNPTLSVACPIAADQGWGNVLLLALKTIEQQQDPEHTIPRSLIAEQLGSLLSLIVLPKANTQLDSRHQISLYSKLDRVLHDNFHLPDLSPEIVAAKAGISRRHLFNIFAKAGISFSRALLEIRLNNARKMLLDDRYRTFRVCDVAWACGFSDLSHFGKRFKELFNCTPSELKNSARDKVAVI